MQLSKAAIIERCRVECPSHSRTIVTRGGGVAYRNKITSRHIIVTSDEEN